MKKLTFLTLLLFTGCASKMNRSHTEILANFPDPINQEDLLRLRDRVEQIPESDLSYSIHRYGFECEYAGYPKVKMLQLLDSIAAVYMDCLTSSQDSLRSCLDTATRPAERNYCKTSLAQKECRLPIDPSLRHSPFTSNCKNSGSVKVSNDPLGVPAEILVHTSVQNQLKQIKTDYIRNRNQEEAVLKASVIEKEIEDDKAYRNSPAGISTIICNMESRIFEARKQIDKENEVGKVSGTVNKTKLHQLGQFVVDSESYLESFKKKYLSVSGNEWSSGSCR